MEAVKWTSDEAHLHVELTNEKIVKNENIQTRGVKNTREPTHVGFVPLLGLGGWTARNSGDCNVDC